MARPGKYQKYEEFYKELPLVMEKRPKYKDGIGVQRGKTKESIWAKVYLPKGGDWRGKYYAPHKSIEIKLGNKSSYTWQQALDAHRDYQEKADKGLPLEDKPTPSFIEWADSWYEQAKVNLEAHKTSYIHIEKHLKPFFENKPISKINTADINRWTANQLITLKPATVRRQRNTLGSIFSKALKEGLLEKNPCKNANPIKGIVPRSRFLDDAEILALMATAKVYDEWISDFLLWALHSGMRRGEILDLTWENINKIGEENILVVVPKSKSGLPRMFHATSTMIEILARQKKKRVDGNEKVFRKSLKTFCRKWKEVRGRAKLEDITLHDLRRTQATIAAGLNVDLNTLAKRLGHSNLDMLHKVYAQVQDGVGLSAANSIGEAFDAKLKQD